MRDIRIDRLQILNTSLRRSTFERYSTPTTASLTGSRNQHVATSTRVRGKGWFRIERDYEHAGDVVCVRDCLRQGRPNDVNIRLQKAASVESPHPFHVYDLLLLDEFTAAKVDDRNIASLILQGYSSTIEARQHIHRGAYHGFAPVQYKLGHAYEFPSLPTRSCPTTTIKLHYAVLHFFHTPTPPPQGGSPGSSVDWQELFDGDHVPLLVHLLMGKQLGGKRKVPTSPFHVVRKGIESGSPKSKTQRPLQNNSPLFVGATGQPLIRSELIYQLRSDLANLCFNEEAYSAHSFRRGASSAFAAGLTDFEIQQLGRWCSDIYKLYIEPDLKRMLNVSS
ncbi:hypothetical protein M422DRAFT_262041 [Sphaerobolus stellatus SS14]|uniref:Tyr recombinase domain-containing protein n=1 Tax=Sphaerobolus stellatus (strain SS14) TaxID=990650 RepID=A0A0C9V1S3_SPHS4|nr:hypothetical protein M422DRAFT_262041 [Sphaerobolus stellatus SS14]